MRFSSVKQFYHSIICNFEPNQRKPISDFWHHEFANIQQPLIFVNFDHSYLQGPMTMAFPLMTPKLEFRIIPFENLRVDKGPVLDTIHVMGVTWANIRTLQMLYKFHSIAHGDASENVTMTSSSESWNHLF